ncbi:hypothetical protein M2119_001384 [Aurantimicrobium minutum]|uniref:hypothetical protein n=1 Tax=Aurantimicrobium minutum TaxID=708131 RepID=UPI00247728A3|nr:hypothetical protein [Aurantimicrobium minutum]MDH6533147.1 hypothetical protein [Aurantimicrobium minutum]
MSNTTPTNSSSRMAWIIVSAIIAVIVIVVVSISVANSQKPSPTPTNTGIPTVTPTPHPTATPTKSATPTVTPTPTQTPTVKPTPTPSPTPTIVPISTWADKTYGTFTPVSNRNLTNSHVINFGDNITAGVVKIDTTSIVNAPFTVEVITKDGTVIDTLVDSDGSYTGITAFGLTTTAGQVPDALKVTTTADVTWSVLISPVSSAPQGPLTTVSDTTNDMVYLYPGAASTLRAQTFTPNQGIVVTQYFGPNVTALTLVNSPTMVNQTSPISAGPSVVTVQASGSWNVTVG